MRKYAIALALVLCAGAAQAGPIWDLQIGGLYIEGDWITVEGAIVMAAATYGVVIVEEPFGVGNGVWVYLGSDHGVEPYSVVDIYGVYEEYYDLTEINVGNHTGDDPPSYCNVVGYVTELPAPVVVDAATLVADGEPYEGNIVTISDGLEITEILDYGEWKAVSHEDGVSLIYFDDFWYDATTVEVGQCYDHATGYWTYSFEAYKLEVYADGFPLVDCTVNSETITFGGIKALYR